MLLIVKPKLETEVHFQELLDAQQLLLVTLMMERKPELDFQVEQEEPFQETAELWSELLLVVEELTNQYAKLETPTINGRQREEEYGQELEVLL